MNHTQLMTLAQETAASISSAAERFCRAVMLYEQNQPHVGSISIPDEMNHAGIVKMANRLREIETEVKNDPDHAKQIVGKAFRPDPGQDRQPELAPPAVPVQLPDLKESGPTLEGYMKGLGTQKAVAMLDEAESRREVLRQTLSTSLTGPASAAPAIYPNGPVTFEEVEAAAQAKVEQPTQPKPTVVRQKENVWKHFLSAKVAEGGLGNIEPGYKGLKLFAADLDLVATQQIVEQGWGTGFYSAERDSTDVHFLFSGRSLYLRVRISGRRPVQQLVLFKDRATEGWLPLNDLLMYEFGVNSDIAAIYREILEWAKV